MTNENELHRRGMIDELKRTTLELGGGHCPPRLRFREASSAQRNNPMGRIWQVKFRRDLNNARRWRAYRPASRSPYAVLTARLRFREASSEAEKRRYRLVSPFFWCGRRDLNPYSVNYTPLKRARLPVPPLPHIKHLCFITRRRSPRSL